jgi:D-threo-aldose 1-dehydrogenase
MPYEPFERLPIRATGLRITRLGFGGASIGGLYREVREADAEATVRHAWDLGIRYFDVAPLYGYGAAERRIGAVLRDLPRDEFVLSTKVGRLVVEAGAVQPGADLDRQAFGGREDAFYAGTAGRRIVFDYSAEGVRRSLGESLERLGLDRIDLALVHDPDRHWRAAITGAIPELLRLRDAGVVRAVGVGMNQAPMLARFVREADIDAVLVAGRYTLLDQGALAELLPACEARGVAVLVAGVMNSGVLAAPHADARFDYLPAPGAVVERARSIAAACDRHDVLLRAAAMQLPLAHPAVTGLITGVRTAAHLDEYPELLRMPIPPSLWDELRVEGLLDPAAPVPG